MSEYAAKNPAIDSGYEDKQSTSTSNDEGQRYVNHFGTSFLHFFA